MKFNDAQFINLDGQLFNGMSQMMMSLLQDEVERGAEPATNEVGIDIGVEASQASQTSQTSRTSVGETAESAVGKRRGGASQTSLPPSIVTENEASQTSQDLEVRG